MQRDTIPPFENKRRCVADAARLLSDNFMSPQSNNQDCNPKQHFPIWGFSETSQLMFHFEPVSDKAVRSLKEGILLQIIIPTTGQRDTTQIPHSRFS